MKPKYIMTRTPDEAVTAIVTAQGKSLELRIPRNVNEEAFKARPVRGTVERKAQ